MNVPLHSFQYRADAERKALETKHEWVSNEGPPGIFTRTLGKTQIVVDMNKTPHEVTISYDGRVQGLGVDPVTRMVRESDRLLVEHAYSDSGDGRCLICGGDPHADNDGPGLRPGDWGYEDLPRFG